ncbi:MAG: phosphopantetheine-binding protein [Chitinophagaceae bacterium]
MERTTVFNEFKTILSAHVPGNKTKTLDSLTEQTNMADDLEIESLDIVSIVIDIEEKFHIEIDNDSIRRMSTVGSCINLIQEKLCSNCSAANCQQATSRQPMYNTITA